MNEEHPNWINYISRIAKSAGIKARNKDLTSGCSVLYQGEDGNLYERHSGGTETLVKKMAFRKPTIKKRFNLK